MRVRSHHCVGDDFVRASKTFFSASFESVASKMIALKSVFARECVRVSDLGGGGGESAC